MREISIIAIFFGVLALAGTNETTTPDAKMAQMPTGIVLLQGR
jgi:hypothetical protein